MSRIIEVGAAHVDLSEVAAIRWSPYRPMSTDPCVIVTLRNGREFGKWWPAGEMSANDDNARELYDQLVAQWITHA